MPGFKNLFSKTKEKKQAEQNQTELGRRIQVHRTRVMIIVIIVIILVLLSAAGIYNHVKNQTYSGYTTTASLPLQQYNQTTAKPFDNGFITYSQDGISYTDYKGDAMWNQTYEMQEPIVRVGSKWVCAGDYNGHVIYDIDNAGNVTEIDTNIPIRNLSVADNGVVAAVLEEGNITWINVYNPNGEKAVGIKTTMAKSGYPMSISLSDTGKLMQVTYLRAENGAMKTVVCFYNFDEVGQNYTDTMVSFYEYSDSIAPSSGFMNSSVAYSAADNQLILFEGKEIPKNTCQQFLQEQIQSIFTGSEYLALVFEATNGEGKYRIDVYNTSGDLVYSCGTSLEYRDIIFVNDNMVIYNEAECEMHGLNGVVRYIGALPEQTLLLKALGSNRFLVVRNSSLDVIELR